MSVLHFGEVDGDRAAGVTYPPDDAAPYRMGGSEPMVFLTALDPGLPTAAPTLLLDFGAGWIWHASQPIRSGRQLPVLPGGRLQRPPRRCRQR